MVLAIRKAFSFRAFTAPIVSGMEYVGLVWEAKEKLTIWLVYHLLNTPTETLLDPLEAILVWVLEYPRLLVLGYFNVHASDAAFSQVKDLVLSMAALRLSQFVLGSHIRPVTCWFLFLPLD